MPRSARIVIPDQPYHVTQRGNYRQDVFFAKDDYLYYLGLLKEHSKQFGVEVLGYCLMTNHIHLVVIPKAADSLSKGIGRTHLLHAQYINQLHGRSGHLWQGRFSSVLLDDEHMWAALRYVDRNPIRAGMVRKAWNYRWSSVRAHLGEVDRADLIDQRRWKSLLGCDNWRKLLEDPDDEQMLARIRLNTRTGRPLGSDRFISKLEAALGRRLRPLPVGRPRKKSKKTKKKKTARKRRIK